MKRFATLVALALAGLTLTACGGAEPAAAPTAAPTRTVFVDTNGAPVEEPVVTVTVSAASTAPDCWQAWGPEDLEFIAQMQAIQARDDDTAEDTLPLLRALPDPSEGCDEASKQALADRRAEADRIEQELAEEG